MHLLPVPLHGFPRRGAKMKFSFTNLPLENMFQHLLLFFSYTCPLKRTVIYFQNNNLNSSCLLLTTISLQDNHSSNNQLEDLLLIIFFSLNLVNRKSKKSHTSTRYGNSAHSEEKSIKARLD